ncbi:lysosome-associated membrane glycoprotein 1 [Asbolus verrucosus]|uniref:Lysosome-associated membrane glycoprotein 5 n=1 Tax=Asbolus verrucosus TaxID=1661398 RepID=A0A482VTV8_ASBVE|nr:lysosome-associated membrane glycoprotein 1 [Asbolus verrucosus]
MMSNNFADDKGAGLIPPGPPTLTQSPTTSTVAPSPTTNATTAKTTTSTTSPTTTTTTTKPTTSTKPTTPTTPTTTTTTKPTTATTKSTTTSPTTAKPTPSPTPVDPVPGRWTANYTNTNNTCLILKAAIQIDVPYQDGNTTKTYKINVPPNATAKGACENDDETITLIFDKSNTVSFTFKKTNDSKYDLDTIQVTVAVPGKNGTEVRVFEHVKKEFATPVSNSYKCTKEQILNLTAPLPETYVGQLLISHLQMQAFRNSSSTKFDEALDCAGSETPDVVPIAVGCALAALVIIVLIAYLIGRRRSQARGYLSM